MAVRAKQTYFTKGASGYKVVVVQGDVLADGDARIVDLYCEPVEEAVSRAEGTVQKKARKKKSATARKSDDA